MKAKRKPYGLMLRAVALEWPDDPIEIAGDIRVTPEERQLVAEVWDSLQSTIIRNARSGRGMGFFSICLGSYSPIGRSEAPSAMDVLHRASWPSHIPVALTNPGHEFHEGWEQLRLWGVSELLRLTLRVKHDPLVHAYSLWLDMELIDDLASTD